MSILDGLPEIISGAMGQSVFKAGTLKRISARVPDGRGGFTQTATSVDVRALVTEYSDFMRTVGGIAQNERKVLIMADGLATPPVAEDRVSIDGKDWTIIEVRLDPAKAVYVCRAS